MRSNPERMAWTVLLLAFLAFCLLITGIPLGIRSYLLNSTRPQDSQMLVIDGTVLVQKANAAAPIGVTASGASSTLSPGDQVISDSASWATLDLFDRSHVIVYNDTDVQVARAEMPRFRVSKHPNRIALDLTGGLIRVGVALPGERPTDFQVVTPHALIGLDEGSYRISVANDVTELTVVLGQARVGSPGAAQAIISQGMRTTVDLGGVPAEPQPSAQNLVVNGDFQEPLATGWLTDAFALDPQITPPTVQVVEEDGRRAVRFLRREGDDGNHTEASIRQKLGQGVRDFTRLEVSLDVLLDFQSLSGGGQQSSEFPVIVRLDFKDRWGNDKFWTHGFYYHNEVGYHIALDEWGQPRGEQVPQGVWYPYESGNLLDLLGDNRPVQLTSLTVYASGWNYDSRVASVQIIVE